MQGTTGVGKSGAAPSNLPAADSRPRCLSAKRAIVFYKARYAAHRAKMGAGGSQPVRRVQAACSQAKFLARIWRSRAFVAREAAQYILTLKTLRDYPFCDGCQAWKRGIEEVQKIFPGTKSWLLSCSAAEGGHGRWVGYSGVAYSTWLRDSDTVGGPLQFRFSTFTGMYRRGVEYAESKGYRVPRMDSTTAWRSALGQAIAGGWARYTGNDDSHWSASWGNGC